MVVRQIDGGAPQPPQRFSPRQFLEWAKKQTALAQQVYSCYEAGPFGYRLHRQGSVQENVMFAPKDLRPSEIMALRTLIGGRTANMPQTLEGIIESACLWACPGVGFQPEQS